MRLKTSSADDSVNYRYSGILVHPTSFPSPYGIGDFGKGAYDFIDFLEASGQHLWQILPLNPITSYGNSPYQGFSVFAGEPLLLSPQLLKEQGLLAEEDLRVIPDFDPVRVDYEAVRAYKYPLYRKAYQNFLEGGGTALQEVYDDFCARNEDWLSDYCLYMAIKDEQEGLPWTKWPEALRNLSEKDRAFWMQKLEKEIGYYQPEGIRQRPGHRHHRRHSHLRLPGWGGRLGQPGAVPGGYEGLSLCGGGGSARLFQRHRPDVGQSPL